MAFTTDEKLGSIWRLQIENCAQCINDEKSWTRTFRVGIEELDNASLIGSHRYKVTCVKRDDGGPSAVAARTPTNVRNLSLVSRYSD